MTDPADLALEEYRNSKDYPDDVNYGIWGRINRAFQDGYAKGRANPHRDNHQRQALLWKRDYYELDAKLKAERETHAKIKTVARRIWEEYEATNNEIDPNLMRELKDLLDDVT